MAKLLLFAALVALSGVVLQAKSETTTEAIATTKLFRTRQTTLDAGRGRGGTCNDLPRNPHSEFPAGTKIHIECPDGYTFTDNNNQPDNWSNNRRPNTNDPQAATCENDGTWDKPFGYCQRIGRFCPLPITGSYVQIIQQSNSQSSNQFQQGSFIQYGCINGYVMSGAARLTCNSDGTWSPNQPPTCNGGPVIVNNNVCYLPQTPTNANIMSQSSPIADGTGLNFAPYSQITYTCNPGYVLVGDSTITCNSNGQWQPNPPLCQVSGYRT